MLKNRVVNLNRNGLVNAISRNNVVIIMLFFYIVGIAVGVFWVRSNSTVVNIASDLFSKYISQRSDRALYQIFFSSFLSVLPFAVIIFLCGTSFVGIALTPLAICYRGFYYGILAGYLYYQYSLKGIAFNSLLLIPCTVISVFGLIFFGKSAFGFSLYLAKVSLPQSKPVGIYSTFKDYCKKSMYILLVFVFSSMLDAVLSKSFLSFFAF